MCSGSKSSKEKLTSRAEAIHRKSVNEGFGKDGFLSLNTVQGVLNAYAMYL